MLPEMPKQTTRTGKHVNRVIDMWLENQPVYYAQTSGGGYEQGKEQAGTKADYITYEMEHGPLDFKELREFMRGLVDAGPARTGHNIPAAIVTLPISGTTDALRANAWMIQQALATGVHGILLCNAESPEAARLMIECRALSVRPARRGADPGHAAQRLAGIRVANVGRDCRGIHAHRRSVADEPGWRIAVRAVRSKTLALTRTSKVPSECRALRSRNGGRAITASTSWDAPAPIRAAAKPHLKWRRCGAVCSTRPRRRGSSSSMPATRTT